ncbi:MAG: hypothetical protein ABIH79_01840 [archaeon]
MKIKIKHVLFLAVLVSFLASYFFPGVGDDVMVQNSITFIGILFGIIVGFFIADLYSRYQGIRANAGTDSSCLSTFYFFAKILANETKNKQWLNDVEKRIHNYVNKFMPLPWERYSETEKEFSDLGKSLEELKYSGEKANETYSNLLNVYNQHSEAREKLVMFGQDKLSWGEWLITFFLGGLLLASLFYVKDTSSVSVLFTGAITSAILLLFMVLRDLNNLNFGENIVSIEPYERVLDAIGKPRYYKTKREAVF